MRLLHLELGGKVSEVVCVSDIHLESDESPRAKAFCKFVQQLKPHQLLIICGDWLEPMPFYDFRYQDKSQFNGIFTSLLELKQKGVNWYFIPGNRDACMGRKFANSMGIQACQHILLKFQGTRYFITHGNMFVKQGLWFQRLLHSRIFLQVVRLVAWVARLFGKDIYAAISQSIRRRRHNYQYSSGEIDIAAFGTILHKHQAETAVFGHFHRAQYQKFQDKGKDLHLVCMSQWNAESVYGCKIDKTGAFLHKICL